MPDKWSQYEVKPTTNTSGDKWAQYADTTGAPHDPTTDRDKLQAAPEPLLQRIGRGAQDLAKGIGEGALSTLSVSDDWAAKHLPTWFTTPIGQDATPENRDRAMKHVKELQTPANTTQRIGKGIEQAGEFLLPTGLEEGAAKLGAGALGKTGGLLGRIGGNAVHSGAINKTQGGTFAGGAAAGAAGSVIGAGLRKIAPALAETALKVRGTDRAYGRTPGQAILDETTGFTPGKIAKQASDKVDELSTELEDMARQSPNSVSLVPARDAAEGSYNAAVSRNNESTIKKIRTMAKQLGEDHEGNEIPEITSPHQLLHLKRGIGDLQTSWNPATAPKWVGGQVGRVYHAMDSELDRALPEGASLNQRISTLLPVEQRANAADLNAGFLQRALGRVGAHTGALAGAGIGGAAGYKEGGLPGAAMGAGLGILIPESLASPEVQMIGARALNSQALRRVVIPALTGAGMQATRPKVFAEPK